MCGGKGSRGGGGMGALGWGGLAPAQQQTTQASPEALNWYRQAMQLGQQAVAKPYQQFGTTPQQFVAQLTPTQQQAISNITATQGMAQPYYQGSAGMLGQALTPSYETVGRYMTPFMGQVVDPIRRGLEQTQGQQLAQQQAEAIRGGAFGGERAGLQRQALRGQQDLAMGQALSPLYQTGYGQALQAAQQQQQFGLQGAQQMAGLGTAAQQAALQQAQAQLGAGTMQQQTAQAGIDALRQQFQQQQMFPYMQAQFLAGLAGGLGPLLGQQTYQAQAMSPFGSFFADGGAVDESRMGGAVKGAGDYYRGGVVPHGYAKGGVSYAGDDIGDILRSEEEMYAREPNKLEEMPTGQIQAAKGLEPVKFDQPQQPKTGLDKLEQLTKTAQGIEGLGKDIFGGLKGAYNWLSGPTAASEIGGMGANAAADAAGGGFLGGLGSAISSGLEALGPLAAMFALKDGGRVGYYNGGITGSKLQANQLYDYYVDELGAHPNEARMLTSAAGAESNYDPSASHDEGTGFGLYGHRLDRLENMRKSTGQQFPHWKDQAKFTLNELRSRPEHSLVMKEDATPEDLTTAQMHFERPAGYTSKNPMAAPSWGSRLARTKGLMAGLNEGGLNVADKDRSFMATEPGYKSGLGAASEDEGLGGLAKEEYIVPALAGLGTALAGIVGAKTVSPGAAIASGLGQGLAGGAKTFQDIRQQQLGREIEKAKLGLQERGVNVEELKANIALKELLRKQEEVKRISDLLTGQKPSITSTGEAAAPTSKSDALRMADESSKEAARLRQAASLATDAETQQKYMTLAQQAENQANTLRTGSPEFKQQSAISDIMSEEFKNVQKLGKDAPDNIVLLNKMKTYLDDPSVYTGLAAEQYLDVKKGLQALGVTGLEKGIADTERFSAAAKKMVTDATGGSLGAGISNADVRFLESRSASLGTSKEANKEIIDQAIKLEKRKMEIANFQREYIKKHGSLDENYNDELSNWANAHPLFLPNEEKKQSSVLPPKDKLEVGKTYTVGGKQGEWTGTGFKIKEAQ